MTNKNSRLAAKIKAMDFLARRDHSEKELRTKLSRHFSTDEVDAAIAECRANHWLLPPAELADRVALSLERKLKSYRYIQHFLRQKGLPPVAFAAATEKAKAQAVIGKFAGQERDHNTLFRLLNNRGFDKDTIKKVIDETRTNSPSI